MISRWLTPVDSKPTLIFLAGCNGAGKSSFFSVIAASVQKPPIFLNADILAQLLSGIPAPDTISQKITDVLREHMLGQHTSFVTETVFSDEVGAKLDYLKRAKAAGFHVVLVYVSLESWPLSKMRVTHRVATGGHSVDPDKLARRWRASHENARRAFLFVDDGLLFDNSSYTDPMRLVAVTCAGALVATFGVASDLLTSLLPSAAPATENDIIAPDQLGGEAS